MAYYDAKLKGIGDRYTFGIIVGKCSRKILYLRSGGDHVACWEVVYLGFESSRVLSSFIRYVVPIVVKEHFTSILKGN